MTGQINLQKCSTSSSTSNPHLTIKTLSEHELESVEHCGSRPLTACDDTSSELQRVISQDNGEVISHSSFRGRGALSRIVRLVVVLREWAHKSLREQDERPDSFLDRFRGPDIQTTEGQTIKETQAAGTTEDKCKKKKKKKKRTWELFVVDPSGKWYYRWLLVVTLPVLYNWFLLVVRACFNDLQASYTIVWLTLDYLCDIIYIADIIIRLRTGHKLQQNLKEEVAKYQNELIKFKKQKLERVQQDYRDHTVYKWLTGGQYRQRRPKKRILKPRIPTIDVTSGESASDNEASRQPQKVFLETTGGATTTRSRSKSQDEVTSGEDKEVRRLGNRSKPPRK
ncbi:cyclic nucleotide-gated olfactory channel-like [Pelobates fuscus]|uniref:cyclic nucleotide-gated olfactory channel-like n=1 Tax=Pelobates fuscus TaxID=191477 RepID=UPI002FE47ECF